MGAESFGAENLEDLERSLEETGERADEILDEYYTAQGLDDFGLQELNQILEDNDVLSDSEVTFIVPRQIPARTVEQEVFTGAAEAVGTGLVEDDVVEDFSVKTVGLRDRMDSRNPEKRGYARVPVISETGVDILGVARPDDGYLLESHAASLDDAQREAVSRYFDVQPSGEDLRSFHRDLLDPGRSVADITGVQRDLMDELFEQDIYPDIGMGVDGKAVLARYDEDREVYEGLGEDIEFSTEQATEEGFLTAEDSYRMIAFPYSFSDRVIHMLNGLEEKFRGNGDEELKDQVPSETPFPMVDFAGIDEHASTQEVYGAVTSTSDYGSYADSSSSLPRSEFGVVSNTYMADSVDVETPEMREDESFAEYGGRFTDRILEKSGDRLVEPLTKDLQ
ncbi:MAG: hypothetical protein ABEJ98_02705 [Candidatus Nanohaloarchaea archaeon]